MSGGSFWCLAGPLHPARERRQELQADKLRKIAGGIFEKGQPNGW